RWPRALSGRVAPDLLRLRMNATLRRLRSRDAVRPPEPLVNATASRVTATVKQELKHRLGTAAAEGARRALERKTGRAVPRLPSGLPVAPTPGLWYTTVNTWHVEVVGEYARFTVRAPAGAPTAPTGTLAYIRDGSTVSLDLDGDRAPERLGRASRIRFSVETWLGVAVPPGLPGVGDTGGQMVETSAGWPNPGPE
ncbi:MAG: hypothetical protein ABEK12_02975, partial [Candidatus Nanohaloarchaea archaeon]